MLQQLRQQANTFGEILSDIGSAAPPALAREIARANDSKSNIFQWSTTLSQHNVSEAQVQKFLQGGIKHAISVYLKNQIPRDENHLERMDSGEGMRYRQYCNGIAKLEELCRRLDALDASWENVHKAYSR